MKFINITFGVTIVAVLVLARGIWLPWFSPSLAAKYLMIDDGKNPLNGSRQAALYWESRIYVPLKKRSNNFKSITWVASNSLIDILNNDSNPPEWIKEDFNKSSNIYALEILCYMKQREALELNNELVQCEPRLNKENYSKYERYGLEKLKNKAKKYLNYTQ